MPGNRFFRSVALLLLHLLLPYSLFAFSLLHAQSQKDPASEGRGGTVRDKFVHQGAEVEFSIEPVSHQELLEGNFAAIQFRVKDATTGAPLPALRPSVWIDLKKEIKGDKETESLTCKDKIGLYMQGTLGYRPDMDLNSYFILSLNNDGTIAVTNPIITLRGITQLHAMIYLKRPGEDWVLSQDQKRLFVSMPRADQVAVVNTETFKVSKEIPAGSNPFRLALQPDGKYVWVGNNSPEREKSGVTVIDAENLDVAAHIPTGPGHHEIAFTEDSLYAFVTNRREGTVSVIDVRKLKKLKDIHVGAEPVSIAYSPLAKSVYVANEGDGTVVEVDGMKHEVAGRIRVRPGLKAIRFSPGGRLGFVANSREDQIYIFDVSTREILHTVGVGKEPDQISFTKAFAYIRSKGSVEVSLIPLNGLDRVGTAPVARIPAGQNPPGSSPYHAVADAIVPTPEEGHALIANPADRMIYYYMEGMSVPMGSFRSYGRYAQRAVLILDRSIRETGQGTYTSRIRIPASGTYQVAFLLDTPRILHCFEFSAKKNPALARKERSLPRIEFLTGDKTAIAGKKVNLTFKITDPSREDGSPSAISDLLIRATLAPGVWSQQYPAKRREGNIYEIDFTPPQKGVYYINVASPSLKISFSQFPYFILHARDEGE